MGGGSMEVSVTVSGSKKRKKRNSGGGGAGGGGGGGGGRGGLLLGKLQKKSTPAGTRAEPHAEDVDPFLNANAQAKMAERKAQREQLRAIRERSEAKAAEAADVADEHAGVRRASKKRRKEIKAAKVSSLSISIARIRPDPFSPAAAAPLLELHGREERRQAEPVPEEAERSAA